MTADLALAAHGVTDYGLGALADVISRRWLDDRRPVVLFLGAGADISSRGLTFAELKRNAAERYPDRAFIRLSSDEETDAAFERLFITKRSSEERARLVRTLFERAVQDCEPSDAYKLLVLLAEVGAIAAVVTTNFDTLLERAQRELGRDVFQVYAPGTARPYPIAKQYARSHTPYIKLHGDLASWTVTVLTRHETVNAQYDPATASFVRHLLRSYDLVIAGYGGRDVALAELLADGLRRSRHGVYWCDRVEPSATADLARRLAGRFEFVRTTFDGLVTAIAQPVLRKPNPAATVPVYLPSLFEWRVDYVNERFINEYARVGSARAGSLFVLRTEALEQIDAFLASNRTLAVVVGPTGYGKTTLGLLLQRQLTENDGHRHVMLLRASEIKREEDLESHIAAQLGTLGESGPLSIALLHRWLAKERRSLVLYVDGINEGRPSLESLATFFRGVVRLCANLPDESSIRVITTMRQETWNAILPLVDTAELRRTLWSESADTLRAIGIHELTDAELAAALALLRQEAGIAITAEQLLPNELERLKDPFLLRIIAEDGGASVTHLAASLHKRLARHFTEVDAGIQLRAMGRLAVQLLDSVEETFGDAKFVPRSEDVLRVMKDVRIIVQTEPGRYRFAHDRIHEFFLALGFEQWPQYDIRTIPLLRAFLKKFEKQPKAIAAARLYFTLDPYKRLRMLDPLFELIDGDDATISTDERKRLFAFAKSVVVEVTDIDPAYAADYIASGISQTQHNGAKPQQRYLRTLIQAATRLPVGVAVPILALAGRSQDPVAAAEAEVYVSDRLVTEFLISGRASTDLMSASPYAAFFADADAPPWKRVGRLIGFVSQIGPDNTHPFEYQQLCAAAGRALATLTSSEWPASTGAVVAENILRNCDRLIFNRTEEALRAFFGSGSAAILRPFLAKVEGGGTLDRHDLAVLETFVQSVFTYPVEFHFAHALMILSALNNADATLQLWRDRFDEFDADTSAVIIDFYQAMLVYLLIVPNVRYDESFAEREARLLRDPRFREALVERPGEKRGLRRGFEDEFEQVFEDGFGIVYPYGGFQPGTVRQHLRYRDYRDAQRDAQSQALPLYHDALQQFVHDGWVIEAVQILQTLSGVVAAWPIEGLMAMRDIIGHPDPQLRKATIRTLAEAYARRPMETIRFLQRSGSALSDDDLHVIRVRQDPHIGRRQVDEEQWARILHFFRSRHETFVPTFVACLHAILDGGSFEDAVERIMTNIGLYGSADR